MVFRERFEEYHKSVFLGRVLAMIFGINTRQLAKLEEVLQLAIFQTAYDPSEIEMHIKRAQAEVRIEKERRMSDARLLAKVGSYSGGEDVQEKEGDSAFLASLQSRRKQVVNAPTSNKDPWKKN